MDTAMLHTRRPRRLQAALLTWLLLGVWLSYSAAMLWKIKVNNTGAMCHYAPPK